MGDPWTHRWAWSKRPVDKNRKGMRCRLIAVGRLGSAQVLFEDGVTHITGRRGLRRIVEAPTAANSFESEPTRSFTNDRGGVARG